MRPFSNRFGFSAVELLTAVSLFAIVTAIAVPNFMTFRPTWQLNGAARQVMAELMWARGKAVQENNQFFVSFPTPTSWVTVNDKNSNDAYDAGEWSRTRAFQTEYSDVTLMKEAGHPDPIFTALGTTKGVTTITVANGSGTRTVTVSVTGSVRIN